MRSLMGEGDTCPYLLLRVRPYAAISASLLLTAGPCMLIFNIAELVCVNRAACGIAGPGATGAVSRARHPAAGAARSGAQGPQAAAEGCVSGGGGRRRRRRAEGAFLCVSGMCLLHLLVS